MRALKYVLGLYLLLAPLIAPWPIAAQPVTNPSPAGIAGAYNSSPPTCTAGQFCFIQTDSAGNLKTSPGGSGSVGKTTTEAKVTVSVTNTFQQALASASGRAGCTLQYIAVAGTKGFVFFGASPSDTTSSFQLTNGQSINCAVGGQAVATDAIQVTGTATDIFIVSNQ